MQGAMCRVCSAPRWSRRCASYTPLTPGAIPPGRSPRFLPYPGPSLGRRVASFPPRHPTCRTSRILAFPCASLAPPPVLSAGYFYPLLVPRCFWGDSGEASSHPLSSRCAPRSGPLLAGSSRKDSAQGSIQQERSAPPPPLEARGLETRVPTARLRRPPLAGGARPRTSSQHPGAGTPPASVAAACALAGSIRSHSCVLPLQANLPLFC